MLKTIIAILTGKNSVTGIVASFTKTIDDLHELAVRQQGVAARHSDRAAKFEDKMLQAEDKWQAAVDVSDQADYMANTLAKNLGLNA